MKMRFTGFLAFVLLSISILSYGVNGSVFAEEHNIPPLFLESDTTIYANGASVTISGNIKDYDSSALNAGALTWIVLTPDLLNWVEIGQLMPNDINSDGSFEFNFVASGGYWKVNGDYTIQAKYGGNTNEITINYVGGDQVITTEPEPEPGPVSYTHLTLPTICSV